MRAIEREHCKVLLCTRVPQTGTGTFVEAVNPQDSAIRGPIEYKFDGVIGQGCEKETVKIFSSQVVPLLDHFNTGGNSCFISYGQKGLGKTEFLTSSEGGLVTEGLRYLFEAQELTDLEMNIVYVTTNSVRDEFTAQVIDLLAKNDVEKMMETKDKHSKRHEENRLDLNAPLITSFPLRNISEYLMVLGKVKEETLRLVKAGIMAYSSSHILFIFTRKHQDNPTGNSLIFADLACSEKIRKSVYLGEKLLETVEKSSSLVTFSKAINYLLEGKRDQITFSEDKLIELLQDALGGNCKTCYVVTVSLADQDRDRTFNSLVFAQRLSSIENCILVPGLISKTRGTVTKHGAPPSTVQKPTHTKQQPTAGSTDFTSGKYGTNNPTWLDKCNSLIVDNGTEVKKLQDRNIELENQVLELEKMIHMSHIHNTSSSRESPSKNISFFSMENDPYFQIVLKDGDKLSGLPTPIPRKTSHQEVTMNLEEELDEMISQQHLQELGKKFQDSVIPFTNSIGQGNSTLASVNGFSHNPTWKPVSQVQGESVPLVAPVLLCKPQPQTNQSQYPKNSPWSVTEDQVLKTQTASLEKREPIFVKVEPLQVVQVSKSVSASVLQADQAIQVDIHPPNCQNPNCQDRLRQQEEETSRKLEWVQLTFEQSERERVAKFKEELELAISEVTKITDARRAEELRNAEYLFREELKKIELQFRATEAKLKEDQKILETQLKAEKTNAEVRQVSEAKQLEIKFAADMQKLEQKYFNEGKLMEAKFKEYIKRLEESTNEAIIAKNILIEENQYIRLELEQAQNDLQTLREHANVSLERSRVHNESLGENLHRERSNYESQLKTYIEQLASSKKVVSMMERQRVADAEALENAFKEISSLKSHVSELKDRAATHQAAELSAMKDNQRGTSVRKQSLASIRAELKLQKSYLKPQDQGNKENMMLYENEGKSEPIDDIQYVSNVVRFTQLSHASNSSIALRRIDNNAGESARPTDMTPKPSKHPGDSGSISNTRSVTPVRSINQGYTQTGEFGKPQEARNKTPCRIGHFQHSKDSTALNRNFGPNEPEHPEKITPFKVSTQTPQTPSIPFNQVQLGHHNKPEQPSIDSKQHSSKESPPVTSMMTHLTKLYMPDSSSPAMSKSEMLTIKGQLHQAWSEMMKGPTDSSLLMDLVERLVSLIESLSRSRCTLTTENRELLHQNKQLSSMYQTQMKFYSTLNIDQNLLNRKIDKFIRQRRAVRLIYRFYRIYKRGKETKRLQKLHKTHHQLFLAGGGKVFFQTMMQQTEDYFMRVFEKVRPEVSHLPDHSFQARATALNRLNAALIK